MVEEVDLRLIETPGLTPPDARAVTTRVSPTGTATVDAPAVPFWKVGCALVHCAATVLTFPLKEEHVHMITSTGPVALQLTTTGTEGKIGTVSETWYVNDVPAVMVFPLWGSSGTAASTMPTRISATPMSTATTNPLETMQRRIPGGVLRPAVRSNRRSGRDGGPRRARPRRPLDLPASPVRVRHGTSPSPSGATPKLVLLRAAQVPLRLVGIDKGTVPGGRRIRESTAGYIWE